MPPVRRCPCSPRLWPFRRRRLGCRRVTWQWARRRRVSWQPVRRRRPPPVPTGVPCRQAAGRRRRQAACRPQAHSMSPVRRCPCSPRLWPFRRRRSGCRRVSWQWARRRRVSWQPVRRRRRSPRAATGLLRQPAARRLGLEDRSPPSPRRRAMHRPHRWPPPSLPAAARHARQASAAQNRASVSQPPQPRLCGPALVVSAATLGGGSAGSVSVVSVPMGVRAHLPRRGADGRLLLTPSPLVETHCEGLLEPRTETPLSGVEILLGFRDLS